MEQFKLKEGAFRKVKRKWIFLNFPLALLGCAMMIPRMLRILSGTRSINWTFFTVAMIIAAIGLVWTIYQVLLRERVACDDYLLTIDQNTITREQFGSDTITIGNDEITKISKRSDGSLVIMRNSLDDAIIVPKQIENYDKLEFLLSGIRPFS